MGSERGEQPLSCNDDDRCLRQKQGGVVGAVASRMQGPPQGPKQTLGATTRTRCDDRKMSAVFLQAVWW